MIDKRRITSRFVFCHFNFNWKQFFDTNHQFEKWTQPIPNSQPCQRIHTSLVALFSYLKWIGPSQDPPLFKAKVCRHIWQFSKDVPWAVNEGGHFKLWFVSDRDLFQTVICFRSWFASNCVLFQIALLARCRTKTNWPMIKNSHQTKTRATLNPYKEKTIIRRDPGKDARLGQCSPRGLASNNNTYSLWFDIITHTFLGRDTVIVSPNQIIVIYYKNNLRAEDFELCSFLRSYVAHEY